MEQPFRNQEAAASSGERVDFSFGENWRKYLESAGQANIDQAKASLAESFAGAPFEGERFVDLGCGSGIFSLSAFRLGAGEVLSVDVDPNSVACARFLKDREGDPPGWTVRECSVLDDGCVDSIGQASRVYSWGVLHHTGAMWKALENALRLVAPAGLLCVALYNRPNHLGVHMGLKRLYNRLPDPVRPALTAAYAAGRLGSQTLKGDNPVKYVRDYGRSGRGMKFWRDMEDWLGGLPFEFASEEEIRSFLAGRPFVLEHVLTCPPGANNEYLIRRTG